MVEKVIDVLRRARLNLATEKATQRDLAQVLRSAGIDFKAEHKLDAHNRPDFFIEGIALEVKINKGAVKQIYKQCERYCEFPEVKALILVTNRTMGFPPELKGKPCYVISLGKAWL